MGILTVSILADDTAAPFLTGLEKIAFLCGKKQAVLGANFEEPLK